VLQGRPGEKSAGASDSGVGIDVMMDQAETVLTRLREWSEKGLLDPAQVVKLGVHTGRTLIDRSVGGDGTGDRRRSD
jgi:hypothetical protein